MKFIFWLCLSLIAYTYLIYPGLIFILARLFPKQPVLAQNDYPSLTMVISAYNEEQVLERKIKNCLAIDYPRDKISFVFGSDGSTDSTNQILETIDNPQIRSRIFSEREGKSSVLNKLIPEIEGGHFLAGGLMAIFIFRVLTTLLSFSSGAPGGVFAPTLALGTVFGMLFGLAAHALFPDIVTEPGTFAIAGMGGLFAATVRAPITGILLVIEMTSNYEMILPLIVTCLGATMVAQTLGGRPIYTQLLERTMKLSMRQKREEKTRKAMNRLSERDQ
jgi:hypothetical protein